MPKTVKKLAGEVLCRNKLYALALLAAVIAAVVCSLLPPQVLRVILDGALTQGARGPLPLLAGLYFGAFVLIGVFDFLKGLLLTVLGQKFVREMRGAMAEKLGRLQASYFSATASGVTASRFLSDVEHIDGLFSDGVISMVVDCFKIIGIVVSIWLFSVPLGLLTLALLPLLAALTGYFRKKMLAAQSDNLAELGKVNNHIAESMKNRLMIKAFGKERYLEARYAAYLDENYATMNRVNFYDACYSPMIQIITALTTAAVLLIAGGGGAVFGLSIGTLAATIALITDLFAPVDRLGTELQSIQKGLSGVRRVDAFLALAEDRQDVAEIDLPTLRREGAHVRFERMSFAYAGGTPVLREIDLHVQPGEHICFVGRTGAGKTTLFQLLTGLLRPTAGRITLNGVDLHCIPNGQKRAIFGYVAQQFSFVQGDVAAQLRLGDAQIAQARLEEVMRFVGLHDYVMSLQDGYATQVSDGSLFSQGQQQLLGIARALATDPPILLLDEVTAHLDAVTEAAVVAVLKQAGAEKTIFSITHRRSSVGSDERVLLLENGALGTGYTATQEAHH